MVNQYKNDDPLIEEILLAEFVTEKTAEQNAVDLFLGKFSKNKRFGYTNDIRRTEK